MSIDRLSVERASPPTADGWTSLARGIRVALVGCWLAFAVLVAVVGARPSTFGDLESAVVAGHVDEVQVDGGLETEGEGFATVRVTWREGLFARTTEVLQARPLAAARRDDVVPGFTAVLDSTVGERLRELAPGIKVHEADESTTNGPAGWTLPGWSTWPSVLLVVLTALWVLASPPPWHATRWAWIWLASSGPLGLAAYLLLSGPLPGLGRRLAAPQRLSGGWAFLLAIGLRALLGW